MDRLIKRFDGILDNDLFICEQRGVAYQFNLKCTVQYDAAYLAKCAAYDPEISARVNAGRIKMIEYFCGICIPDVQNQKILDIGVGSGDFFRAAEKRGLDIKGYDVIPEVAKSLDQRGKYASNADGFDIITLWDTIEHMPSPASWLKRINKSSLLFVSVPIFDSFADIRKSKHYRPGEHLYYWTNKGFVDYMALYGYRLLGRSDHEICAGRDNVMAYAFCRELPRYHDYLVMYAKMHETGFYGGSSTELHLHTVADVVRKENPKRILDFGCGRSDLVAHFWCDGKRDIARYDPAINKYKSMPEGKFDLILCCDVLEHIPMASIDKVLGEIKAKGDKVLFTISTKPARAKLPDGTNAHITLLTRSEWRRWLDSVFGSVRELPSEWDHELIIYAGE